MPACSPSWWSMISVSKRWRSAQRRYMRRSISAQSVASVPPAPALIDRIAARSSYSPENSRAVRSRREVASRAPRHRGRARPRARRRGISVERARRPPRGRRRAPASRATGRSRSAGRRPRGGPSGRRAGRPRSRAPGSASRAGRRARALVVEVKDAPRSTGSVQPGRGWRTRPPSSGPGDPGAGSGAAR